MQCSVALQSVLAKRGTTFIYTQNNSLTPCQHEAWLNVRVECRDWGNCALPQSLGLAVGVFMVLYTMDTNQYMPWVHLSAPSATCTILPVWPWRPSLPSIPHCPQQDSLLPCTPFLVEKTLFLHAMHRLQTTSNTYSSPSLTPFLSLLCHVCN